MRMMDFVAGWDHVNLPDLVGIEVALRQAQLYEYMYAMEYEVYDSAPGAECQ